MIEFKNLEIRYGDHVAMAGLNLRIERGEFFTFLGPSGCGKTTTLRALAGFVQPSAGEILVEDKIVNTVPIEKRGVGIVFQSYALFPSMSVYDNLAFGLKVQKCGKEEMRERILAVAGKVALREGELGRNVAELSGGQQQRVALARAIVLEPRILCLDEPLSNLDAKLRVSLRSELKRLQQELGITTLYVTHDQTEALTMSDRIAVFNNGCVEQVGTPYEIYNKSASRFVCDFIGDTNLLNAETIREINRQAGSALQTGKSAYIRLERVGLSRGEGCDAALPGVVSFAEYDGVHTKYTVDLPHDSVRCYQMNNGTPGFSVGSAVTLHLNASDIMQF